VQFYTALGFCHPALRLDAVLEEVNAENRQRGNLCRGGQREVGEKRISDPALKELQSLNQLQELSPATWNEAYHNRDGFGKKSVKGRRLPGRRERLLGLWIFSFIQKASENIRAICI